MACSSCAARRERMKAWIAMKAEQAAKWARVRNANAATDVQASQDESPDAQAEAGGQAGEASPAHGHEGMASDPDAGADPGRIPVPRVRKAGGRKGGAR